ncbi:50S ribosomal protein L10 [Candidatus Pacearchaeota archaeon CG10_big_fil_rev_8_21_14_0_10_35_13]|nr:MAG: 50S ribosomal protein L10 [Candidatus Pacearchaeota archaeon CG10_big_fil_rev_8_21_14_0_10_35_13]
MTQKKSSVPKEKVELVKNLGKIINENKTFLIASIRNLPGGQYQAIKHKLRGHATVKFLKKNIMLRGIEGYGKNMKQINDYVKEDCAFLFSKEDPFKLSMILTDNQTAAKAKVGQVVNEDVVVQEGPTDLTAGPVISEFGALGIPIQMEEGKIHIKKAKTILKAGDKVTQKEAGIMSKLDIKPFKVGFEPVAAYDSGEDKVFTSIKIDKEKNINELLVAHSKALGLTVSIAYPTRGNIGYLLAKAASHEKALSSLSSKTEEKVEIKEEESQGGTQ